MCKDDTFNLSVVCGNSRKLVFNLFVFLPLYPFDLINVLARATIFYLIYLHVYPDILLNNKPRQQGMLNLILLFSRKSRIPSKL